MGHDEWGAHHDGEILIVNTVVVDGRFQQMRVLLEPAVSSICAVNNAGACGSHPRHPGPLTHHLGKLTGGASIVTIERLREGDINAIYSKEEF